MRGKPLPRGRVLDCSGVPKIVALPAFTSKDPSLAATYHRTRSPLPNWREGSGFDHLPIRIPEREPKTPKAVKSQRITAMITTTFKIFLMVASIGM
jgi:hypothetical protein